VVEHADEVIVLITGTGDFFGVCHLASLRMGGLVRQVWLPTQRPGMRDGPRHAVPCRFRGCGPTGELGIGVPLLPVAVVFDSPMRDFDPSQYAEADRREVNPPVEVKSASWAPGGTPDWWVKERQQ